jgi:hypothetical protein
MDFFIMLSSAFGIFGNAGQSNYAAGNTFQDSLARFLTSLGRRAVSIDLGMTLDEGFVAERKYIQERLLRLNLLLPISKQELFALFDYYCNPRTSFASPASSQIIIGIELPAVVLRAGKDIPDTLHRSMFRTMHQIMPHDGHSATGTMKTNQDVAALFKAAPTLSEAGSMVAEALKTKVCNILGLDADRKTTNDWLESFGVDSLIALEIRNWLAKEICADLAVYEILGDVKLINTITAVDPCGCESQQPRLD